MNTFLVTLTLIAISTGAASAPKLTGTFSTLRFGTEDLSGIELTVVVGGEGHYVIAQCAEGAPGIPEVAVATLKGAELSFQLLPSSRSGCPTSQFRGTVTLEGLKGAFEGVTDWPGFLKRGPSYWQ